MHAPELRRLLRTRARQLMVPVSFAAVLVGGCEGDLADSMQGSERRNQSSDDPGLVDLGQKVQAGPPMMRNLSNREYLSATSDLIGERLPPELQAAWTVTTQFSGFDAVPWTNLDTKAVRDRSEALETILDKAVASPKVMRCTVSAEDALAYAGCAKSILEPFASRAYGRALRPDEAAALAKRYDEGVALARTILTKPEEVFTDGVRAALGSILLAPQFMTRSEPPPSPDFTGVRDLTAAELASRVSFMFLGSVPDDELWARAEDGSLTDPEVLVAQVRRLLETKTDAFVQSFMGQWFDFRAYDSAAPDTIEHAMWNESWRTMADVVRSDLPATSLVQPGFTYVNKELAAHYGIPGDFSADYVRVQTGDRGGVLQQGSWLTLSASPLKTSPIHRGRLVQDRLLCKVIPPPDSALFEKIQEVSASIPATATVKQRVEMHRNAGEACFGCHQYMDPIGIGLEGFDQFGKVRSVYDDTKLPVETDSNILGKPFATFNELNQTLATLPDYERCAAEKLAVFSVRKVVDAASTDGRSLIDYLTYAPDGRPPSIREMVLRMVKSNAFRKVNHGAKD